MIIRVSDHALLRFVERASGHDLEPMRTSLAASLGRAAKAAGDLGVMNFDVLAGRHRYVIRNGVLVTITGGRPPAS